MKLLQRIRNLRKPKETTAKVGTSYPVTIDRQPKGHVVKAKSIAFNPDTTRHGGRVVKAMPKDLRKMKEAQERDESSTMPFLPKE